MVSSSSAADSPPSTESVEKPTIGPRVSSLNDETHLHRRFPRFRSILKAGARTDQSNGQAEKQHHHHPSHASGSAQAQNSPAETNGFVSLRTFLTLTGSPTSAFPDDSSPLDVGSPGRHLTHPSSSSAAHSTVPNHAVRVRKTPIFSGLVAPFAIVLEVPGLTQPWYAEIDNFGVPIKFVPNPKILTAGLIVSLSAAVIANLAIILRFLEILPPRVSIAFAFAGFALQDLINIVALCVFAGIYGPRHDGLTLSGAFWMNAASTLVSLAVTASLLADYIRTKDFRHAGSGLSQLQKGLVLAGMGLLLYLSLGSVIFVFLIKIDFITALYFCTATVLTVGFGDVVPPSVGGKIMVVLYAPLGIVIVALVVSSARNTILETFQESVMRRRKEYRRRLAERRALQKDQKRKDRALRKLMPRAFTFSAATGNDGLVEEGEFVQALQRMEREASSPPTTKAANTTDIPTDAVASTNAVVATPTASASDSLTSSESHPRMFDTVGSTGDPVLQLEISALQNQLELEKQKTEQEFLTFEAHAQKEADLAARIKLLFAFTITVVFLVFGAVVFKYAESWSFGESLWFCFIAMITIGYGDYHPTTQAARGFFVMWGLMGVAVLTILLAVVQDSFGSILHKVLIKSTARLFDRAEARAKKRRMRQQAKRAELEAMNELEEGVASADEVPQERAHHRSKRRSRSSRRSRSQNRKSKDFAHSQQQHQHPDQSLESEKGPDNAADGGGRTLQWPEAHAEDHNAQHSHPHHRPKLRALDTQSKHRHMFELPAGASHPLASLHRSTLHAVPEEIPAKVEATLVSQPQKVAHAALLAFHYSYQVLQIHESLISQVMTEIPALRHYYMTLSGYESRLESATSSTPADDTKSPQSSTRRRHNTASTSVSFPSETEEEKQLRHDGALQNLFHCIQETGKPEYEKVAKMVVANLDFEKHLKSLLSEISGLKTHVEEFQQSRVVGRTEAATRSQRRNSF